MRDIFANTTCVVVWAGRECDEASSALQLLVRLRECAKEPLLDDMYRKEGLSIRQNSLPLFEDPSWTVL